MKTLKEAKIGETVTSGSVLAEIKDAPEEG